MAFRLLRLLLLLASVTINLANASDIIRYVESKEHPDPKQRYFIDLLTLALEASKGEYGDYQLQSIAIEMGQGRTSIMLQHNKYIDVAWRMTSKNLEQRLQAIYFPTLKGLMGYRIFIIRKGEQKKFSPSMTVNSLKAIHLGQGHNWPDTDILQRNGFNVIKGDDNYLLGMLKKGRFDYFPRALHEPWHEITNEPELTIEKSLMFKYAAPMYFFVNKQNKRLQQRLKFGFSKILASGRFEQFFSHHPITSGILTKTQASSRTVFELHNPLLSVRSQKLLNDKRLWIELK